jgi:hypothetical protein
MICERPTRRLAPDAGKYEAVFVQCKRKMRGMDEETEGCCSFVARMSDRALSPDARCGTGLAARATRKPTLRRPLVVARGLR